MQHDKFELLERLLTLRLACATQTYRTLFLFLLNVFFFLRNGGGKLIASSQILDPFKIHFSTLKFIRPVSVPAEPLIVNTALAVSVRHQKSLVFLLVHNHRCLHLLIFVLLLITEYLLDLCVKNLGLIRVTHHLNG